MEISISEKSMMMFDEALSSAREIEDARSRAEALRYMARRLAKSDTGKAMEVLDEALSAAGEIGDERLKGAMLRSLAEDIMPFNPERALSIVREIDDRMERAEALREIATRLAKRDYAGAEKLLDEAFSTAREIEEPESRARALQSIAEDFARMENEMLLQKVPDELVMKMVNENWDANRIRETLEKYR